jgi:hypothetical protein
MSGNTKKDSKYLKRITEAIAEFEDHPKHSKNAGINMQAHHLISEQGLSKATYLEQIDHLGYDINVLENLVFMPTDPFDACHMGVQVHRSGHTSKINTSNDPDDDHPKSYHEVIETYINAISDDVDDICENRASENKKRERIQRTMNSISKNILKEIRAFKLKLTSSANNFDPSSKIGCSNFNNIQKDRPTTNCKLNRTHNTELPKEYELLAGR